MVVPEKITKENVLVIIPAFNEAGRVGNVIRGLKKVGIENILVVDDGSSDATQEESVSAGAEVVSHIINRGPGAATQTGIEYAKIKNYPAAITIDADGQHFSDDIAAFIEKANEGYDIVVGNRFKNKNNQIPSLRRFFNFIANCITAFLSARWYGDSQSGFKILSREAIKSIELTTNGFEFSTELLTQVARKNLKYTDIPIKVIYSEETMSKGQSFATGIKTVFKLFLQALSR